MLGHREDYPAHNSRAVVSSSQVRAAMRRRRMRTGHQGMSPEGAHAKRHSLGSSHRIARLATRDSWKDVLTRARDSPGIGQFSRRRRRFSACLAAGWQLLPDGHVLTNALKFVYTTNHDVS
jgi:hypothetical protein